MKLFPLLSLFSVLPLSAQHLTDARWSDDSLHLGFSLVEDRKAGSDYAIWATPVLTDTKGHRLDLPVSIFRGKRNQRLHERQQFYQPQTLRPLPVQGKACEGALGDTIDYQLSFDRRTYPWLWEDSNRLDALREAEGCCQVDSLPLPVPWHNCSTAHPSSPCCCLWRTIRVRRANFNATIPCCNTSRNTVPTTTPA
ncbi:MAG: hypothetical protein ACLS29_09830 [Prevotellamassilia sp.]